MSRSRTLLILCVIAVLAGSLLRPQTSPAQTTSPQPSDARTACASDVQKLCAGVPAGGGRVLACLKQHKDEVSDGCKQAILAAIERRCGFCGQLGSCRGPNSCGRASGSRNWQSSSASGRTPQQRQFYGKPFIKFAE